jgi:hypothetical protein
MTVYIVKNAFQAVIACFLSQKDAKKAAARAETKGFLSTVCIAVEVFDNYDSWLKKQVLDRLDAEDRHILGLDELDLPA